jgi:N-acetylglutamate synthase-like GNAT family acetyltransferase
MFLHGPVVTSESTPLEIAAQLVAAALDHASALGARTVFARPQSLDRVWVRFGFIPVPEGALPAVLAGRPGRGLFAWRGGSALWSLRDTEPD